MTPLKSVTVDDAIIILNRALDADRVALTELVETRVPCNQALLEDPTIQVAAGVDGFGGDNHVGLLGILNGIFGEGESGPIMTIYGVDGEIEKFARYVPIAPVSQLHD